MGAPFGQVFIYDVADPLAPRRLCTISTALHVQLLSNRSIEYLAFDGKGGESVDRQTFGSAPEVIGPLPAGTYEIAWGPNAEFAYETSTMDPAGACCGSAEIHVVAGGADRMLCSYQIPIIGIGGARFFPTRLFDLSADGSYFTAGTPFGKGTKSCSPFVRVADGAIAATLPTDAQGGFWSRQGQVLYLQTGSGTQQWTPVGGFRPLTEDSWIEPNESPDGRRIAYTYYKTPSFTDDDLRVGVYDLFSGILTGLPDKPRSQAGFVTKSVLWYLEEGPCGDSNTCHGSVAPNGNVLAYDLTSRTESPVTFAAGEDPVTRQDYGGFGAAAPPAG